MDHTPNLSLPFIMPQQAQKHITHNEALQALDILVQPSVESRTIASPPATPMQGEAWLVPPGAIGSWAGHAHEIAAWQAGAWLFYDPAPGWQVYVKSDRTAYVFDAGEWVPLASLGAGLRQLGINTNADATNRLAIASSASLFTHAGAGHQLKLNKATPGDTASLLYQTNWSGRAEMGLAGGDDWQLKTSPDGANWHMALTAHAATGAIAVGTSLIPATDNAIALGGAGARWSTIWSATGTIQTSDLRLKTDVAPSDLGLEFILALNPVRYRWLSGGAPDGEALPGQRTHYGLLAQEVEALLADMGIADFGGHVLADPADPGSEQGLRYDAFIAPLIAAIQQLCRRLDTELGFRV